MNKQDDTMKEAFKETFEKIVAPEDLKAKTLVRMGSVESKEENIEQRAIKKKSFRWYYSAAGAAALCAAVFLFVLLRPSGVDYITPMEDGVYYDTVELKDGEIHFVKNRVAISITPNAGVALLEDKVSEDGDNGMYEMENAESGGTLEWKISQADSLLQIADESWSYIGDQQIYVTVLKTEEMRYQAVYEKDGISYEVIGTGTTQKEFVDYLYKKVQKK